MAVECISSATKSVNASRPVGPCVPSRDVSHSPRYAKLNYLDLLPTVHNRWQWNAYLLLQSQLMLLGQMARAFLLRMWWERFFNPSQYSRFLEVAVRMTAQGQFAPGSRNI